MAIHSVSERLPKIMNQESSNQIRADKILVVGHPLSNSENVEALLNSCGMQAALPAHREGILPADINATLLKSLRVNLSEDEIIEQVYPSPIWNGLAMDLLMGNLEQEFWGWSDSQAIYLLDYWKSIDPRLAFLMVYESPHTSIARAFAQSNYKLDIDSLKKTVTSWVQYNEALLRFFNRNPKHCLLVHAQQITANAQACLQEVRLRIGAPISTELKKIDEALLGNILDSEVKIDGVASVERTEAAATENELADYLAQTILQDYPAALQLYEEMQVMANLPLTKNTKHMASAYDAWDGLQNLTSSYQKQINVLKEGAQKTREELEKRLQVVSADKAGMDKENELLLLQLHQVQEELEKHYLQNKKQSETVEQLNNNNSRLQNSLKEAENKNAKLQNSLNETENKNTTLQNSLKDAENKVEIFSKKTNDLEIKSVELQKKLNDQINQANNLAIAKQNSAKTEELEKKLALIEKQEANTGKENELLLLQLHQVQEELERYYLENQKLKRQQAAIQPVEPKLYGAAERVKKQLSYRLGATMIEHSRSLLGWLTMVFALFGVALVVRKERAKGKLEQLPPISEYVDASEADRVKKHLSYRLGVAFIKCTQSPIGLFKLPWALYRAEAEFQKERRNRGK